MKLTLAAVLSLGVASAQDASSSSTTFLRKSSSSSNNVELSACNKVTDQDTCFQTVDEESGMPCSWCVAGAIPSECVTQEQAKDLPPSVFECSVPGRNDKAESSGVDTQREMTFNFVEDRTHTFFSKDNEICDPSSKSLSGYMDIKGSDYDKDGQNKHLFYWMFEKRGDKDENTPFIVRFSSSRCFFNRVT